MNIYHRMKSRFVKNSCVLAFHRISNNTNDPYNFNVSPTNFTDQMEIISKYANPVSVAKLVSEIVEGKLTPGNIAVTFDDGYSDNFYRAKPILEKFDIPASIFISTGDLNSEFWWDELERLILTSPVFPEELYLKFSTGSFFWTYEDNEKCSPQESLFSSLLNFIKDLTNSEIIEVLVELRNRIPPDLISDRKYRTMAADELVLLSKGGLIDAGSHSVYHQNFSKLTFKEQEYEDHGK